jgi:hypothetical protein
MRGSYLKSVSHQETNLFILPTNNCIPILKMTGSEVLPNVARYGLQQTEALRGPGPFLQALSVSYVANRGKNADEEAAKAKDLAEPSEDLMFIDSSQQGILGGTDWDNDDDGSKDWNWRTSWLSNLVEPAISMYKGPTPPGMTFYSVTLSKHYD